MLLREEKSENNFRLFAHSAANGRVCPSVGRRLQRVGIRSARPQRAVAQFPAGRGSAGAGSSGWRLGDRRRRVAPPSLASPRPARAAWPRQAAEVEQARSGTILSVTKKATKASVKRHQFREGMSEGFSLEGWICGLHRARSRAYLLFRPQTCWPVQSSSRHHHRRATSSSDHCATDFL